MINAIIGDIVSIGEQSVVLRTSGIEFLLLVSGQTASRLSQLQGEERRHVRLLAVLHHREDSMTLFGFFDEDEREAFEQLQGVAGIGAKQALRILSGISVRRLAEALDGGDVKLLSSIPGIGPKTGQKMILALRNKLVLEETADRVPGGTKRKVRQWSDIIDALCDMGYDRRKCEEVIEGLAAEESATIAEMTQRDAEQLLFRKAVVALG